jgi:hypothetical protein
MKKPARYSRLSGAGVLKPVENDFTTDTTAKPSAW